MIEEMNFGEMYESDPVFLPEKLVNREGTFKCERRIECQYCDHRNNCSYTKPSINLWKENEWSDYPLGNIKIYGKEKEYTFRYDKNYTHFIDLSKLERGRDYGTIDKDSKGFYNLAMYFYLIPKDKHQLEEGFITLDTVEELVNEYDIYVKMPYQMRNVYNPKNSNICIKLKLVRE